MSVNILGVRCDNLTIKNALEKTASLLISEKKANIFFLNADCLLKSTLDPDYFGILNSAGDLILPDGIGLRCAALFLHKKWLPDCNGTDFSPQLIKHAAEEKYKIFFIGSKIGIAEKAADNIYKKNPQIQITGTHHGYFSNDDTVIKKINDSGADILFVSMSAPLQEKWIYRNREKLNPKLCLGVGALLDYLAGSLPRAPKFLRWLHLEWLWRILIEPDRMIKRYIIDGTRLFFIVLRYKVSGSKFVL